ncbi:MAG: glycerol dehydratase reactivase beta/small subunit family protein [Cellulosilyticaceae bacterium]
MIRPTIVIKVWNVKKEIISEVLAGIEEEGVLSEVIEASVTSRAQEVAEEAARLSQLEVGIGIAEEEAILTIHKLKGTSLLRTQADYRMLGQNAARYVKGNSFTHMIGGEL